MKCPKCQENKGFDLIETADDYQDGIVICLNCGEEIATFNYTVLTKYEKEQLENDN